MINMLPDPTMETMTEDLSDFMFELGYDSKGKPPFFGNSAEERQLMEEYNEGTLGSEASSLQTIISTTTKLATSSSSSPFFIFISGADIKKMKVDLLKCN